MGQGVLGYIHLGYRISDRVGCLLSLTSILLSASTYIQVIRMSIMSIKGGYFRYGYQISNIHIQYQKNIFHFLKFLNFYIEWDGC